MKKVVGLFITVAILIVVLNIFVLGDSSVRSKVELIGENSTTELMDKVDEDFDFSSN